MAPSSTSPSARSPELQKQLNEVKSRLTDFIEATRPAHEANLRRTAALRNPSEPEQKSAQPKTTRPPRNATNPASPDAPAPDSGSPLERHARKCKICNLPNREAFEADFLDWCQASWLQQAYHIRDESTIYRHARATGLLQRRRENVRMVAEKILEHVDAIETPSAFAILRAIRTLACLNERGQWTEPPTTHVVVNATQPPAPSPNPITACAPPAGSISSSSGTAPAVSDSRAAALHSTSRPSTISRSSSIGEVGFTPVVISNEESLGSNSSSSDSRCGAREPSSFEPPVPGFQNPNRQSYEKLELGVTDTKQTSEVISNRR